MKTNIENEKIFYNYEPLNINTNNEGSNINEINEYFKKFYNK